MYVNYLAVNPISAQPGMLSAGLLRYRFASSFLTSLLLFKQLAFTAYVTSITFCSNILTNCLYCFAGNNLSPDSRLNGNIKLLPWNQVFQFLAHPASQLVGVIKVSQGRKRIHRFAIQQNIQLYQFGRTESVCMIVKRSIPLEILFSLS